MLCHLLTDIGFDLFWRAHCVDIVASTTELKGSLTHPPGGWLSKKTKRHPPPEDAQKSHAERGLEHVGRADHGVVGVYFHIAFVINTAQAIVVTGIDRNLVADEVTSTTG